MRFVVKEVVVLGDICDDAEPIRHFHGHHVFWVQQGRNPQLFLCYFKCLQQNKGRDVLNNNNNTNNKFDLLDIFGGITTLHWILFMSTDQDE